MKYIVYIFCLVFCLSAYAVDEYQIKSNDCYGNNDNDVINELYKLNDTTYATVFKFSNRYGYFASPADNSTWLVKLDKNYKIIAKTLVSNNDNDFRYDPVTQSVCFIFYAASFSNYKVYSLKTLAPVLSVNMNDTIARSWEINFVANASGGYLLKYAIQHPSSVDSLRVIVVDASLRQWCNQTISTNYFDDVYPQLTPLNLTLIDKYHWLSDVFFDNNNLYTNSFVHTSEGVFGKTAIITHQLDKNLAVKHMKILDYTDTISNFQIDFLASGKFFRVKDKVIYKQQQSEYCAAFYLLDTSLNLIKKVIPPNAENRPGRYFFREFTANGRLYVPAWFYNPANSSDYLSYLFCYDSDMNLIHDERIDAYFGPYFGIASSIVATHPLEDSGFLFYLSGSYNGMNNRFFVRSDKDGKMIWTRPMAGNYVWRNKILMDNNGFGSYTGPTGVYANPAIERIASKERAVYDYRTYLDRGFGAAKDTTLLVEYKINLENGKIMDTTIVVPFITSGGGKNTYFNYVSRTANGDYALFGTSNQLCTSRGLDYFAAIASKNLNTIVSKVFLDLNSNGILDGSEHYLSDVSINITKNNSTTESYFEENGNIVNFVDTGKYEISVNHNLNYFVTTPLSVVKNYTNYGNRDTLKFALQPIAQVNDLLVQLSNAGRGRPGFAGFYILNVLNNGSTIQNARVKLALNTHLDSIITIPPATLQNDSLLWTISGLEPGQQQAIQVNFHYQVPPSTNIGDTLVSTAVVLPLANDTTPDNNRSSLYDVLSGSYDPNDKLVDKSEYTIDDYTKKEYLTYTIRFENTGNDTAFSIVIKDTLDTRLDVASFIPLNGKYHYTATITNGNVVTFTFNPIRLPEHSTSAVSYMIKPRQALSDGISILNRASIKFDYNEPIITNSTQTRISLITGISNSHASTDFRIYPNPAQEMLTVECSNTASVQLLQVLDVSGRVLKNVAVNRNDKILQLNVLDLPAGLYILNIISEHTAPTSVKFSIAK